MLLPSKVNPFTKSDLKAAYLLYKEKEYRTSYLCFQQASEKASKALALTMGLFEEKDLLDIRHDQMKVYKQVIKLTKEKVLTTWAMVTGRTTVPSNKEIATLFVADGFPLRPILSVLQLEDLKARDLTTLSTEELNEYLFTIEEMDDNFLMAATGKSKDAQQMRERLVSVLGIAEISSLRAQPEKWQAAERKVCRLLADLLFITSTCFFCAILTIQHSSKPRYPSAGHDPLKLYRGNLPIVRKQQDFMDLLSEALRLLARL